MKRVILFTLPALFLLFLLSLIIPVSKVSAQENKCRCNTFDNPEWGITYCGIVSNCNVGYTCPIQITDCDTDRQGPCENNIERDCVYQGAGTCTCSSGIGGCSVSSGCTSQGYTAVCGENCSCTCERCGDESQPCCGADGTCNEGLLCIAGTCTSVAYDPRCTPSGGEQGTGINTAIGCIPVAGTQEFTEFLLRWGTGIAGGIAILLIIYATFLIMTSAGNPQRLQAGKELLTAAIMGLVLLLFGAFILQLIGVKILNIPGFATL